MNHDGFDHDLVTDDEFFGELADMIELVDTMTRERLGGGELDRRRKKIMDLVRGRTTAELAGDASSAPAPRPEMDTDDPDLCVRDRINHNTARFNEVRSLARGHQHHGDLRKGNVLDGAVVRHLGPAVAAAMADAERYRDSALSRAVEIVKKAQQEADGLLTEARRTLDEARRTAATAAVSEHRVPEVDAPDQWDLMTPPPGQPSVGWNVRGTPNPSAQVGPEETLTQFREVDSARLATDVMPPLAETVAKHPALYLIVLHNACDGTWPRPTNSPAVVRAPSVSLTAAASWLASNGATVTSFDFVGPGTRPDALLYTQCKSNLGPSGIWRQALERHWPTRHPLAQLVRAADNEMLQDALPKTSRADATAALAGVHCARDRNSHLACWSALLHALIAAGADSVPSRFTPELLQLAGATPRIGSRLPILSPTQRLLLACDIDGFGRADASLQTRWQYAVRQIIGEAASETGLDSSCWERQRTGDSELAILPLGTAWRTVFEQLIGAVDRQLHEYNQYATDDAQLRLRIAVHEGAIASIRDGFAGQAATTVTRLVDAPLLKQALHEHPKASMAVAVSDPVYHEVTHGRAPERDRYMRITIPQSKGPAEDAWVFVPDGTMRFLDWMAPDSAVLPNDRWPTPRQRPQAGPRQTATA